MPEDVVEVVIDSIRVSLMSQQRIIILREVNEERYLPIWIGVPEAESIAISLQQVEVVRPLTHDLLYRVFNVLGAQIQRVEVISLNDDIFYGNIVVEFKGQNLDIDSRPSDALALAVRAGVPIMVGRTVMETAGIRPEKDIQEEAKPPTKAPEAELEEAESSEQRLSVFEDFIEKLDLNELGKSEDDDEKDKN